MPARVKNSKFQTPLRLRSGRANSKLLLQKGFTLIELLIVISVIGALAAVTVVTFSGQLRKARDAKRKSDFAQVRTSLVAFYADCQKFPDDYSYKIGGCGSGGGGAGCEWGFPWTTISGTESACVSKTYMGFLPADPPRNTGTAGYNFVTDLSFDPNKFWLWVSLERTSDSDILASQARCPIANGMPYASTYPADVYVVCEN